MSLAINGTDGIDFNLDDAKIKLGAGDDLQIYHDGTKNIIKSTNGNIEIDNNAEYMARFLTNGAVELYYDNAKKFETTSIGAKVSSDSTAYLQIVGGEGGSACLALTPDESDDNADEVRLITNDGGATYLQNKASGGWETNWLSNPNGNIELYYDNAKKAETVTGGFTVTGTCTATAFAGDGSSLTGISGGKILHVVQGTTATEVSSTTTSMADTGLSASITPATNSKVLVLVNQSFTVTRDRNSTNNNGLGADILRGSTIIFNSKKNDSNAPYGFYHKGDSQNFNTFRWTINWLDANPGGDGSTSITYKTQFGISTASDSGQGWAQNDTEGQNNAPTSTMILM